MLLRFSCQSGKINESPLFLSKNNEKVLSSLLSKMFTELSKSFFFSWHSPISVWYTVFGNISFLLFIHDADFDPKGSELTESEDS